MVGVVLLYHSSRPPVEVSLTSLVSCDLARVFCANFVLVVIYSFCLSMEIRWEDGMKANLKTRRAKDEKGEVTVVATVCSPAAAAATTTAATTTTTATYEINSY